MSVALVPELYVSNLAASLAFYTRLGFTIRYARQEEAFAYLEHEGAELMLEEPRGRVWLAGPLERPYGRGMNLQITVSDAEAVFQFALSAGCDVIQPLEERSYRRERDQISVRQFVLADPDGYLLRFSERVGVAPMPRLRSDGGDMEGGCFCGAVRYRLTAEPYDTGWCHCRVCQRISGAPALVFTTVGQQHFIVTQGEDALGTIQTTSFGHRQFCTRCGTPLTIQVDHQPAEIDIAAATLDDPDAVTPGFHIYYADRPSWSGAGDDLPRHDRLRPDTRGLPAGATSAD